MSKVTEVRLTIAAIIYAIEIDLKNLINRYIVPFNQNLSFMGNNDLIERTKMRFKKDNSNLNSEPSASELLEYLDFGDFYRIILSNKLFFPDRIISEIKDSLKYLDTLAGIRNRVMHTRPLMSGDFTEAYTFTQEKKINRNDIWNTLGETSEKIEKDPSYVLTLSIPVVKYFESEAHHNLPIPDFDETGFIGRKKDVNDVMKLILGSNNVISIIGDGGIGKTALALKIAYDILDLGENNPFDIIIWVSAKTTMLTVKGIQEIENTLKDYGGVMNSISEFVGKNESQSDHLSNILEYLEVFDTLLIIDNLETILDNNIREFIRSASQRSKLLITSRIGLGELEFRRPLEGLTEMESTILIRQLAKLKQSRVLNRLPNDKLVSISKKLHFNPLALKWFVNSVESGISPNEVLSNTENLLNFCLSNVYSKLSKDSKFIIQTILASRKDLNDAELVYTTEMTSLALRRSLNELFSTTFISRDIEYAADNHEIRYSIPEFAKEYILKNHPIESEFIKDISERIKKLNISTSNIRRVSSYNEFGINALTMRNSNEKVVARLLIDALRMSKAGKVDFALEKVNEAKSILPNYFEVYRVSAFIKATFDDILGAEADYKLGLEIEPNNPRLLYFYGSFLLYTLSDIESAFSYAKKVFELRPDSEYPNFLFARILSTTGEHSQAVLVLQNLIKKGNLTKQNLRIANTDLMSVYSYWGKAIIEKEGDYQKAIMKFKKAISIFDNSINSRNSDGRMNKQLCNVIKTFIKNVPKAGNLDNIEYVKETLIKYDDQISLNHSKEYLHNLLRNVYDVDLTHVNSETGVIIKLIKNNLYTFIKSPNGEELFAHKNGFKFKSDFDFLKIGMKVNYDIGKNSKGKCAINISVNESATNTR